MSISAIFEAELKPKDGLKERLFGGLRQMKKETDRV
jgi:hypothetical protein